MISASNVRPKLAEFDEIPGRELPNVAPDAAFLAQAIQVPTECPQTGRVAYQGVYCARQEIRLPVSSVAIMASSSASGKALVAQDTMGGINRSSIPRPRMQGVSPPQDQVVSEAVAGVDIGLMTSVRHGFLARVFTDRPDGDGPPIEGSETLT